MAIMDSCGFFQFLVGFAIVFFFVCFFRLPRISLLYLFLYHFSFTKFVIASAQGKNNLIFSQHLSTIQYEIETSYEAFTI